jgi:hypothetical protein
MSEQDKSSNNIGPNVESKEGERGLLSCNKVNVRSPSLGVDTPEENTNAILTLKTIEIFTGFAATLKKIHIRLVMEGYVIKNGKIYKPGEYIEHEEYTTPNSKDK